MKRGLACAMSLAGVCAAWSAAVAAAPAADGDADDPLLQPIAAENAARWLTPVPPVRIFGNTWLVGFGGLSIGLIVTSDGLILIDGAVPQGVRAIEANLRSAGFRIEDVRLILSTEPHYDHAGGLAALVRDSGATVVASAPAAAVLHRGRSGLDDPQAAWLADFPPVARLRIVEDGDEIRLGDTIVTARATPGHTAGSMSWSWRACEGEGKNARCANMVFASSLNPIAADGYRFSDPAHAGTVAAFRRTFAAMRGLRCDILLTAHPDQSGGDVKYAALLAGKTPNPFLDRSACRAYANRFERALDARLAEEGR